MLGDMQRAVIEAEVGNAERLILQHNIKEQDRYNTLSDSHILRMAAGALVVSVGVVKELEWVDTDLELGLSFLAWFLWSLSIGSILWTWRIGAKMAGKHIVRALHPQEKRGWRKKYDDEIRVCGSNMAWWSKVGWLSFVIAAILFAIAVIM